MNFLNLNKNYILFFGICLCLITFSFNYPLIGFLRISDIFFIMTFGFFLLLNPKVNINLFIIFLAIVLALLISFYLELSRKVFTDTTRLVFIYKYLFVFSVPWLITSVVKTTEQIKTVNTLLLINFILLSSWSYIYVYLIKTNIIEGNLRSSFPFGDFSTSDSHLFSSYLGFFLAVYLFYLKNFFRHSFFISTIIILNSFIGLVSSGSRSGILIGLISLSIFLFIKIFLRLKVLQFNFTISKKFLIDLTKIFIVLMIFIPFINETFVDNDYLVKRSLNFNFSVDPSSLARLHALSVAIDETKHLGNILGVGFNSSLRWYDGILSILISHGGILIIFLILIFYYLALSNIYLKNSNSKKFLLLIFLIILYFLINLISEFIFVSRNAFPALVILSILYTEILEKKNFK